VFGESKDLKINGEQAAPRWSQFVRDIIYASLDVLKQRVTDRHNYVKVAERVQKAKKTYTAKKIIFNTSTVPKKLDALHRNKVTLRSSSGKCLSKACLSWACIIHSWKAGGHWVY
jgi:hypothetical protein